MKRNFLFLCILSVIFTAGCNRAQDDVLVVSGGHSAVAQEQVEGKILGAIIVLNRNEISAASLAEKKAVHPAVRQYAAWLYKEHSQNLNSMEKLSHDISVPPESSSLSRTLQQKGQRELAALNRLDKAAFDKAYIAAMVKGHTEAVELLTIKIKQAQNPLVRKQLELTRKHVVHHLQKAKAIQKQLD